MKSCALIALMVLAAAPALGQTRTGYGVDSQGGRFLSRPEVERLVFGSKISMSDGQGGTKTWTHGPRGSLTTSLERPGGARPLNGQGTATVDANGAYCVRIEWPRTVESWCRNIFMLEGAYYTVWGDPRKTQVTALHVVQPNTNRLSTLSRLWSLARFAGATAN